MELGLLSSAARAGVVGDSVTGGFSFYNYDYRENLGTRIIEAAGSPFTFPQIQSSLSDNILELVFNAGGFHPPDFSAAPTLTNNTKAFPGFYTLLSTTTPNFSQSSISTLGNTLRIGITGIFNAQDKIVPSLTPLSAVPEPETYAMLLAGMGLIGSAVRRGQSGRGFRPAGR